MRFIPAPAGNTLGKLFSNLVCAVHPRACGEHRTISGVQTPPIGSSPRLRGTHIGGADECWSARFIPAPAGNTFMNGMVLVGESVHPRACGEHTSASPNSPGLGTVHPRACGEHGRAWISSHFSLRFIPAPAGNTCHRRERARRHPVHPRACGEHRSTIQAGSVHAGSSPRLRGTRHLSIHRIMELRFIPAPAGNTHHARPAPGAASVHPRACGEHHSRRRFVDFSFGSSPRLRGTLWRGLRLRWLWRFIPAPAGNTRLRSWCLTLHTVHPRACGEHTSSISMISNGTIRPSNPTNKKCQCYLLDY